MPMPLRRFPPIGGGPEVSLFTRVRHPRFIAGIAVIFYTGRR